MKQEDQILINKILLDSYSKGKMADVYDDKLFAVCLRNNIAPAELKERLNVLILEMKAGSEDTRTGSRIKEMAGLCYITPSTLEILSARKKSNSSNTSIRLLGSVVGVLVLVIGILWISRENQQEPEVSPYLFEDSASAVVDSTASTVADSSFTKIVDTIPNHHDDKVIENEPIKKDEPIEASDGYSQEYSRPTVSDDFQTIEEVNEFGQRYYSDHSVYESETQDYTVNDEIRSEPGLLYLIIHSKSINSNDEKQSWINLIPLMDSEKKDRLYDILIREKVKLREIEDRYAGKKREIQQKYISKWEKQGYIKKAQ